MKKLFITTLITLLSGVALQAQYTGWSIAANGGIATGEFSEITSANVGADFNFLTAVTPNLDLGGTVGYGRFLGKDIETDFGTAEVEDYSYIPVAAAARVYATDKLFAGLQGGYAFGVEEGSEGGFLYRVKGGYKVTEKIDLFAMYQGISNDGDNLGAVGAGIAFLL
ncbi:hypothetical protein [Robertkochia sediminum]|uniref:hypothetical protein n=1 Tax=Robertkochia sediminum TaxID=2785326 RepID=UPI0019347F52|nr:hypothetical protein [Robertkochia sediminum]MBL7471280.1 hypothetical protein [Robertkochia sediminum]